VWLQYIYPVFPAPPIATKFFRFLYDKNPQRAPSVWTQGLAAHYSQPVHQVFEDTVRVIVADELSLDVLLFKIGDPNASLKLPSWVPEWSDMSKTHLRQFTLASEFRASAQIPAWIDPFSHDGLLEVGAIIYDKIS